MYEIASNPYGGWDVVYSGTDVGVIHFKDYKEAEKWIRDNEE